MCQYVRVDSEGVSASAQQQRSHGWVRRCLYVCGCVCRALHLSSNDLNGTISATITTFSALVSLDLSSNGLSGSIPTSATLLHQLTYLDLSNNVLTGRLRLFRSILL